MPYIVDVCATEETQTSTSGGSNGMLAKIKYDAVKIKIMCRIVRSIACFLAIVLSIVSISFACVAYSMVVNADRSMEGRAKETLHKGEICLPCSGLMQGPYEEDNDEMLDFAKRTENNVTVCCAEDAELTSKLFDLFLRRKIKANLAEEYLRNATGTNSSWSLNGPISTMGSASAHLVMGLQNSNSAGTSFVHQWSLDDPIAHMNRVHFGSKGRLVVEENGLYFIYSQISYDIFHLRADSSHNAVHHSILRYSHMYPNDGTQVLLKSSSTLCWAKEKYYEDQVTYVGAAIFLNVYDELYVEVSNLSLISRDLKASYFGLFKAG